jgi:cell shape-determining protein MreC
VKTLKSEVKDLKKRLQKQEKLKSENEDLRDFDVEGERNLQHTLTQLVFSETKMIKQMNEVACLKADIMKERDEKE